MKDLYTSHVHVVGGRDGSATSSDGLLSLKLGFPKDMGGAGDHPNPEQLFAAGYAACFASSVPGCCRDAVASRECGGNRRRGDRVRAR
ncbi:MAG: hypothetical protein ACTHOH_17180 [Lysobacteraceae bacterium]